MRAVAVVPARGLIFVIELYRNLISPLRLPSCRFMPTCSQYAVDALKEYGLIRGSWLAAVRLAKCGPWHQGGWDPIPERSQRIAECGCSTGDAPDQQNKRAESEDRVL